MLPSSRRTWLSAQRPARLPGKAPSRLWSRVVRLRENGRGVLRRVSCAEHSELWFSPTPDRVHVPTHILMGILTKFHSVLALWASMLVLAFSYASRMSFLAASRSSGFSILKLTHPA